MTRTIRLPQAALLGLILATPAAAGAAAERGVYWEQVMEMEMPGMPFAMPPQTMKICLPVDNWSRPPDAKKDPNCEVKDLKRSGNTMSWKIVCTGENAMTGEGEMTKAGDTYSGQTKMTTARGSMNMKLRGKKLGGDCDVEELKKKGEEMKKQVEAQQAELKVRQAEAAKSACDTGVKQMQTSQMFGQFAQCKDPARQAEFCARMKTASGYRLVMAQAQQEKQTRGMVAGPEAAAKGCGADLAAIKADLCARGEKVDDLAFLADFCPEQAKVLAKRECAGRGYTAMQGSRYATFCSRVWGSRQDEQSQENADAPKKKDTKEEAVDKGKKLLKGLGF
jgi:hypothetical protein